jgi:hypothetical protein
MVGPTGATGPSAVVATPSATATPGDDQRPLVPSGSWVASHRDAIMGVTPFVALVLFFTTKWWVWFLLIPAMGAFLYAGAGQDSRGRRRRSDD